MGVAVQRRAHHRVPDSQRRQHPVVVPARTQQGRVRVHVQLREAREHRAVLGVDRRYRTRLILLRSKQIHKGRQRTMAQSLGSLGTQRSEVDMDFDYFGETIRVHPQASDLRVMDFMMRVGKLDIEDESNAKEIMDALAEQLLMQIHPEDASRFWETAKKNNQQMKDIMAVSKTITEAVADFPTGQPSDSTDGPTK